DVGSRHAAIMEALVESSVEESSRGRETMSVERSFESASLVLERERLAMMTEAPVRSLGLVDVLKRAFSYWRPYWLLCIPIIATMFLQEGFGTFFDLNLQQIIDNVLVDKNGP